MRSLFPDQWSSSKDVFPKLHTAAAWHSWCLRVFSLWMVIMFPASKKEKLKFWVPAAWSQLIIAVSEFNAWRLWVISAKFSCLALEVQMNSLSLHTCYSEMLSNGCFQEKNNLLGTITWRDAQVCWAAYFFLLEIKKKPEWWVWAWVTKSAVTANSSLNAGNTEYLH